MKWSGTSVFFVCLSFLFVLIFLLVLFCFFHVNYFSGNLFRFLL